MWHGYPNSLVRWLVAAAGVASAAVMASPATRDAPNQSAVVVNQLVVAGNACGPAALLNALRFGGPGEQRAATALAGANDKESLLRVIREVGMRPSDHMPGRARWGGNGVSVADLQDMGNEMMKGQYLLPVRAEVLFRGPSATPDQLLRHVHRQFDESLAKGFPPILSLRRYVLRRQPGSERPQWIVIESHFVTLASLPRKLDGGARELAVSYLDPWGGKRCRGAIGIPEHPRFVDRSGLAACLEVDFPQLPVALNRVQRDERSIWVLSAALGRW